uniref:Integral membrane protein, putative n=1 Tax=Theileria annulata TaxID=5874 RepID=A0A3B0N7R9_THEAN
MEVTGYKSHIDTSRTNRYSSLYHDWFMIGVGCFTYFLVGLSLTLVYVLCEMDYFMLSGLFRIQRFFSDDAYYFSKQVVLMYGVIGFIFTLVIGPIGKISCILWSWILTLTYLVFGTYSYLFGFTQYGKLLIRSISIISFITHILMCNFIFFLFDPMTNPDKPNETKSKDEKPKQDNGEKTDKSKKDNGDNPTNPDNRSKHLNAIGPYGSLVYYRVIMFLVGFFLGSPILLFMLRFSLSVDTFSEKDPIMSSVDMCRIMMLMFSISVMASIFLTLTFSNAQVTEYTLIPFRMISFRRLKKTMFNFFDIELLVVVWIINPLIMTLIPYTIRIHSEFHKFTLFHRLLFSLFLIAIMILMHRDILYSCIRTIKLLNASIFNILYTDGYTQIKDEDLRKTPVSTTPYSNYTLRYHDDPAHMAPNEISIPSEISYPYFDNGWDHIENQDKKLVLRSYQILQSLERLTHYINTGGEIDIHNIHIDPELSLCKPQIDISDESETNPNDPMKSTVYLLNEYKSELMSMVGSSINRYSNVNKTFITIDFCPIYLLFSLFRLFILEKSYLLQSFSIFLISSNCLAFVSVFNTFLNCSAFSTSKVLSILTDGIIKDDSHTALSDQSMRPTILLQTVTKLSKHLSDFIWTTLSHNHLEENKILIKYLEKLISSVCDILGNLKFDNCCCICCRCTCTPSDILNNLNHPQFYMTKIIENYGTHLCLCLIINFILKPSLLIYTCYFVNILSDFYNISKRKFDTHYYSTKLCNDLAKFIFLIIGFIDKILVSIEERYLCKCDPPKCCCNKTSGGNCSLLCRPCNSSPKPCYCSNKCDSEGCCCNCKESKPECKCKKKCCCRCFCRCPDEYYFYFVSMILYISQLIVDVFTFDNENIRMATQYLLNLIAEYHSMNINPHKVRINNSSINCKETNSLTSFKIGYEITISDSSIELKLGLSKILLSSLEKKCLIIKSFGLIIITEIKTSVFNSFFQKWSELSFSLIKAKQVSSETKKQIKTITNIISEEYMLTIKKQRSQPSLECSTDKCSCKCCKIICICIRLFSNKLKLISSELTENGILKLMDSTVKISELNALAFDKIRMINTSSESLIKSSKNSKISDSTSSMIYGGDFDHINPKYFGYDDVYRPHPHFGSGYFKFVLSRVFIVIILLFMFIFIRTRFDRFVKPDIFGAYLIKVDSNINRFREVLHNRLGHSIRNIGRIGSLNSLFDDIPDPSHHLVFEYPELADIQDLKSWSESDSISDTFTDAIYDEQSRTVQESRRRKVAFYIVIIVFSLLSSLYLNFVVRDLSVMLNLDHSTWSYFICITILMGMIISLVVKYCVHLYDFVYVLEKYSNRLTKIESFVDDSFGGITGNLSYTSKFLILFQLLRSLKTDIVSLFSMNYPYHIPAQSLMKNKVYPYKDMTSDMERMMTCENIECIRSMVIETIGTPESMDLQNILDFISYAAIRNTSEFDKYHGYFSGNERYLAWRLGKLLSHNFFLLTYGRYSCILEMDHIIRNLHIPITQFHNCQMLWQLFGNYESNLISLKCLGEESIGVPLSAIQRDVLRNKFNEEYIGEFTKYQEFIMRNLHINTEDSDDECSCYFPYPELIKCPLDRDKVSRLTREYFGDNRRLSLSLPTTNCNVTKQSNTNKSPAPSSSCVSVTKFCDHWLNMRLDYCDTEECEKAVRFAYDLIVSKLSSDSDIFESIKETIVGMKLNILNTEEVYETPQDIHVPIKSSEHKSLKDYTNKLNELRYKTSDNYQDTVLDYLNRYMMETVTNTEKIMVPLGIFLSWYGIPICEQHIRNMGKFQYLI